VGPRASYRLDGRGRSQTAKLLIEMSRLRSIGTIVAALALRRRFGLLFAGFSAGY
jgi:hypothetical protein